MFSSKFLSGANPLSAMSSAVNKLGRFGDDVGEGDQKKKADSQQGAKGPQQPGTGPQKAGQGPTKQQGNGQVGNPPKSGGQAEAQKPGAKSEEQSKAPGKLGPQQKPQQQQGSPKVGVQHQSAAKGEQQASSKGAQQQASPKSRSPPQQQQQQQQGPPKGGLQPKGSPRPEAQQQTSKTGTPIGSPKPGQAQSSNRTTGPNQQASSGKHAAQDQGPKDTKTAGPKAMCPVCTTTELNLRSKEPPNYSTCTKCKTQVCSFCGFSPPDSAVSISFVHVCKCMC